MQVTKEYVQNQLENLKKQHDSHIANANAASGGIQILEQLKVYLEQPEPVSEE